MEVGAADRAGVDDGATAGVATAGVVVAAGIVVNAAEGGADVDDEPPQPDTVRPRNTVVAINAHLV